MKLTEQAVQTSVGGFYIFSTLATFLHLYYLRFVSGEYSNETFVVALFIILPMSAGYAILIAKHFVDTRYDTVKKSKTVTLIFALMSLTFTILFVVVINFQINKQREPDLVENFGKYLGLTETAFGAYLALILKELFKEKQQ